MKKHRYPCALLLLLLLMTTVDAFSQRRRQAMPSPAKLLASARQAVAKQRPLAPLGGRLQSCSYDSLVFTRQSQIDSFPITNPGCTVLRELKIYGDGASPAITSLDSLYAITEITGFFEVDHTSLTNLNGLSGLQRTAWLWLGYNPLLTNAMPPNLTYVGSVLLNELPSFTSFTGFTQNLTSSKLGYLWLFNNVGVTNFNGLQSLDTVQNIGAFGVQSLTSMQGLQNVTYCHDIGFFGCGSLTNVSAINGITDLPYGSLKINYCYQLTNWNGLQNITRIGGILEVIGSDVTALNGLNQNLIIENSQWNEDTLRIENNYQLVPCGFPPLCNYLSQSAAAVIRDNDPSCSSLSDVIAACGNCTVVGTKTWTGNTNDEWTEPDNWMPAGVPNACDSVIIPDGVYPRPALTGNTTIHALTMENGTELYFNGYGLTVNGDVNAEGMTMGGGTYLTVNNAQNVNISNSTLYIDSVSVLNYKGGVVIGYNTIGGNLTLSDNASRNGNDELNGNTIGGNLSVTVNTGTGGPQVYLSQYDDDQVWGAAAFTINTPVPFYVGQFATFHVAGDLTVKSNFSGAPFTLYPYLQNIDFNGGAFSTRAGQRQSASQAHVTQLGTEPIVIHKGSTNKASTDDMVVLDQPVFIYEDFRFGSGLVKTETGKMLVFKNNAKISQTSSGSWVWGPMKKIGTSPFGAFKFPVGTQNVQGAFEMGNPQQFTDEFTGEYFYSNPTAAGYDTAQRDPTLKRISGKEWWKINRVVGSSNVSVWLRYDSLHSAAINTINDLRVARWGGSSWANEGVSTVSGNLREAYVKSAAPVSSFGVFSLGYTPTRIPVITIGNVDSIGCRGQAIAVPYTVDTAMNPGNVFAAQLSDSTGSFAAPVTIGLRTATGSGTIVASIPGNTPLRPGFRIRVVGNSPKDTSVNTASLRIKRAPVNFSISGPAVVCAGASTKYFASQKEDSVTYAWSITPASVPAVFLNDTATVSPTAAGFFNLQLSAANVCATATSNFYGIQVLPPPPTGTPALAKRGRWLDATKPLPAGSSTYRWYRNDTLITGATAASYYASQSGSYKVKFANACGEGPASNVQSYAANALPQTIMYTPVTDKVFSDSSFTVIATASSGLPVEFVIVSGPGNIPGNVFNITGTGTIILRATQPGNDVYDTAAYVLDTFVISKASQVITFAHMVDRTYPATPFALTAGSTSALPIIYSIQSGPATVNGSTLTVNGVGTVTVRASQAGDANYLAALPVDRSFCVRVADLNGINGPISICPGIAAIYTTLKVPGAVYTWRLQGGNTFPSTNDTLRYTWPSPGTYTLIVSAAGSCGAPSKNDTLVVTAITSVAPDSVYNMLPVNGAINQQLPLQLSWIPANPNLYYTYDLYLWKAGDPQPSTPYKSNLTTVNYTLPLNAGLQFNTAYKWMVAAHNGSCTQINTGPVQTFTLIPLPDLQVFNVTAPATAFSGQSVSVTWRVKNNGPGNTLLGQRWTDAVFISKDSVLEFPSVFGLLDFPVVPKLMATKPNVSALNNGEQYNDTATFTLPIDYSGPLYLHVITNYQPPAVNPVIETTYVNDTAHAVPVTAVTLSPQPDFRVDTVLNPGNTFSGSLINVTYKVKNYGVTGTGSWVDKIYISKDAVFNPATALRLNHPGYNGSYFPQTPVDIYRNTSLQADSSYTVSVQAVVPNFIFGQYYVYVVTNATASLYEGPYGGNNMNRGPLMQVFLTQTPQLTPQNLSIPSVIGTAQSVAVSWQTKNGGAYDNIQKNLYPFGLQDTLHPWGRSQWYDRAFFSTDSAIVNITSALKIAETYFNEPIYPANVYYGGGMWAVPDNLPTGDYWLYVFANATKSVFEYPGLPQIVRSGKVTVVRPDLLVPSVNAPTTGNSGQPVSVSYTVQNNSGAPLNDRYRRDYFYLGNNATFDGTAVLIDSAIYTLYTIPANGSTAFQKQVTLPNGISGAKYLFVKANGFFSFTESSFANNTSAASLINIALTPPPDLTVANISLANTVYSSIGFPFAYTVNNVSSGIASGAWKDSVFVSCNSTFNYSTAHFITERPQQLYVPAAGSYTDSFNLKLPQTFLISTSGCMNADAPQVYFFVKTNASNGVYEAMTANNVSASSQKTVINAIVDHIVTAVGSADTLYNGRYNKALWTVKNGGLNPADNTYSFWYDGIYLSTDSVLSGDDRLITYKGANLRLNPNASYNDSLSFYLSAIPAGPYYLFVKTNPFNNIPAERNLSNNAALRRAANLTPLPVYVVTPLSPDLTDSIVYSPASVAVGQQVKIVYTVTNNGAGAASGNWHDNVWLSNSFAPGGLLLGQRSAARTLLPGQSYTDSVTATVPLNYVQGNYVIVVHAAAGGLYEIDYTNNYTYRYLSVYTPAPVDLVVNNITAADTLTLGYPATIGWTLFNNSANGASGTEADGVYLSTDSTSSNTADVLVGTKVNALNILPLNGVAITSQPVISNVAEGGYYLKVRTDILRNIIETNTGNNMGLLNKKVYVKVKVLPMNVTVPDALTNTYLYYKLIVPAALKGKTIQVRLTSSDSLTATNQLYIGVGYVPSAAKFDYAHSAAGGGNQQIIIESALDTVYYIAARNTKPGTQTINLKAVELPFALLVVNSNKGGNTGNVTVKLSGTLFSNNMTAKIRGVLGNNVITTSSFYFVNGTTAYATFNLRGAPLGVYDVSLTKPDNSVALLPTSFTVEATNSGGLLTGGTNTGQIGSGSEPGCDPGAAGGLNTQLSTELVIPPKVFASWPFVITINYTNTSNVDIPVQVRVLYSHDGAPLALTEAGLADGKTSIALEFKDAFGAPNVIRAGSTGTLKVYSKAPPSAGAHSYINFNLQ